jgi:hypothetical protein
MICQIVREDLQKRKICATFSPQRHVNFVHPELNLILDQIQKFNMH